MIQERSRKADALALAAAAGAVTAGSLLLVMSGAPMRMPIMNLAALGIGLTLLMIVRIAERGGFSPAGGDLSLLAAAALVPMTALMGSSMDGVSRWLVVGGLTIQPALILVPPIALGFAQRPSAARLAAVSCAAAGLALQPDAGSAAMLFCGVAVAVMDLGRDRRALAATLVAGAALLVAGLRAPTLAAVPFVEHVLADALRAGPATAIVAATGVVLMLLPAILLRARADRKVLAAFAAVWAGGLAASVAANYPTPVIGFGGSAILGYFLSVGVIRARPSPSRRSAPLSRTQEEARGSRDEFKFAF